MKDTFLNIRREGAVDWVTLDRPDALNTLTVSGVGEMSDYFAALHARTETRVVVLRGAGGNYCAGLDIKQDLPVLDGTPDECMAFMRRFGDVVMQMRRAPQPIISILEGAVAGGGFAFALASDIRIATPDARLAPAFMKIGLSGAEMGVSYLLPRLIGAAAASEILLCGRSLGAEEARSLGLISRVEAREAVEGAARAIAAEMLAATPLALRLTKEALQEGQNCTSLEAAVTIENRNQALAFLSRMPREGVLAFREKRKPNFGE